MEITFTGHQIEVSQALRQFTQEKFDKILRHIDRITSIKITFSIQKIQHIAEVTIQLPGKVLHASAESTADLYNAVDALIDKVSRLIEKYKAEARA